MKLSILPITASVCLGLVLGIGTATFEYAEGLSYLSKDPESCVNCHIMQPQYDAWLKASHHSVATCADCHLPTNFPDNYLSKAENGWNHSKAFTLQNFHEPITLTPKNSRILNANCVRCHSALMGPSSSEDTRCVRCHASVGHGDTVGLGGALNPNEVPEVETP